MFESWPFTNFHDLNLDWIVKKIRNVEDSEAAAKASEEAAAESEDKAYSYAAAADASSTDALIYADAAEASAASIANVADQVGVNTSRIDTLIANAGDGTIPSELADMRVSFDGVTYTVAGDSMRAGDTINHEIDDHLRKYGYINNRFDGLFKQGLYGNTDGVYNPARTDYVCTVNPINITNADFFAIGNVPSEIEEVYIKYYDSFMTAITTSMFIGGVVSSGTWVNGWFYGSKDMPEYSIHKMPENAAYMHVSTKKTGGITPATATPFTVLVNEGVTSSIHYLDDLLSNNNNVVTHWNNVIYYYGSSFYDQVNNRLGMYYPVYADHPVTIEVADGYLMSVSQFSGPAPSSENEVVQIGWVDYAVTVPAGLYFIVNIRRVDDATITPEESVSITFRKTFTASTPNYVLNATLQKTNLALASIGQLQYHQAFCIYNNKYYSTDGTNIARQAADFSLEIDTPINLGHGNSLQLGSNGIAYASGWNDDKVYIVNLETLTVTGTINLPTTGYTTAAIDDVKGLAYIFQRDTYPDTEEAYNFIVYDYINNNVLHTNHTTPFAAMQACDLLDDKIIVLNGLGTNAAPNGCKVYDPNGNVLASYVLATFASTEPEGVAIDRATNTLHISVINKQVYTLTS